MESKEYIKKFTDIKIKNICKKLNISQTALSNGHAKKENYIKVKEEIESEIAKLYLKE